jgi:uroporphyrinogen-III synthase
MLLVTRPQPSAVETARKVRALGHRCIVAPLLTIQPTPVRPIDTTHYQAIVVTSGQAARALAAWPHLNKLPAVAVGDKTAALLRAAGFKKVSSANGAARELVDQIRRHSKPRGGGLLIACALTTGRHVAEQLKQSGFSVGRVSVYAVHDNPLSPAAMAFLRHAKQDAGILFYSARTARAFIAATKKSRLSGCTKKLIAYCLSETVARAVQPMGCSQVRVAARPTEDAMLALLSRKRRLKSDEQRTTERAKAGKKR